jgi:hypothetical protein
MKNLIFLFIAVFMLTLASCSKDTLEDKAITTLRIDNETHTYISKEGVRYIENTLNSQEASHVYKLNLVQGIQYRIAVSQPGALINETRLKLVNADGDLLSESINEGPYKSVVVIFPPRSGSYYVIVSLEKRTNPHFDYRLFFEEVRDDDAILAGLNWKILGDWTVINANTIELKNHDSHIYRHLRLTDPVPDFPDVSFVLKSTSTIAPNFGFLLNGSDQYIQFGEYSYEFTNSGYGFLAMKKDDGYASITLSEGSMGFEWGTLSPVSMNFSTGVKVDLKYNSGYYVVYINDSPIRSFQASLNSLYIILFDQGNGVTTIQDLQVGN